MTHTCALTLQQEKTLDLIMEAVKEWGPDAKKNGLYLVIHPDNRNALPEVPILPGYIELKIDAAVKKNTILIMQKMLPPFQIGGQQ